MSLITFIHIYRLKFIQAILIPADQSTTTEDLFANGNDITCIGSWLYKIIVIFPSHYKTQKQSSLQKHAEHDATNIEHELTFESFC